MYSDRNFEIRPEFCEELPGRLFTHLPAQEHLEDFGEGFGEFFRMLFITVVLLLAALFVAALLGMLDAPKPQTLTRKECATCQFSESQRKLKPPESRETMYSSPSPRTPINPQPNPSERSSPIPSGSNEVGASAPSFTWRCAANGVLYCRLYSNGVPLQGFILNGAQGTVESGPVSPNVPTPVDWGCMSINETELYCTLVKDGRVFGFSYDGVNIKEFK
jgi:hypothetical protein